VKSKLVKWDKKYLYLEFVSGFFRTERLTNNNYQGYIFEVEDCFIADAEGS